MTNDDGAIRRLAAKYQRRWDRLKLETKRRVTGFAPLVLRPYRSHGSDGAIHVFGRLMEEKGVQKHRAGEHVFWNIANTIRRLESDEIPDARVEARWKHHSARGRTDHEGFFDLTIEVDEELESGWIEVDVELLESIAGSDGVRATAEVLVPGADADFVVISDIDDTVLETRATDMLTRIRLIFSRSARERSPMPGSEHLYRHLASGPSQDKSNPFFYVSRSGWGLYDLILDFLDHHELPKGPLYLQDVAIVEPKSPHLGSRDHKGNTIRELMEEYPGLSFVLIGDSGQEDPETYRDIVSDDPARVRAVLIRSVTAPERDSEVRRIIQEIADMGVAAAAAESSVSLARAAADFDLIPADAIPAIREGMVEGEDPRKE